MVLMDRIVTQLAYVIMVLSVALKTVPAVVGQGGPARPAAMNVNQEHMATTVHMCVCVGMVDHVIDMMDVASAEPDGWARTVN